MTSSDTDTKEIHPLSADSSNGSTPVSSTPSSPPLSVNNTLLDDVTTIFVVGFPDDMQEREFQNMFTFSKGFEAASLKWHCKDQEEQNENSLAVLNSSMSLINKKQMIGFARFRTRHEASEAAEVLNGKKVDTEKGSMLKAEMAKKNLHIKRGSIVPSNIVPSAVLLPEPGLSPLAGFPRRLSHPQICASGSPIDVPDYESFSPLPSDLLSPADYKNDPFNSLITSPIPVKNNLSSFADNFLSVRSHSFDARSSNTDTTSAPSPQQPPTQPFPLFSKSLKSNELAEAETETDPFHYLSKSSPVSNDRVGSMIQGASLLGDDPSLISRKKAISINNSNNRTAGMPPSSPIHNNQHRASISGSFNINPADQNPPCNTLYVGNLPPNTSEEELKDLFAACQGYKRMSFRTKPQGPMCFVEFEDVVFATQAMNEHQGHVLSNSVKGGIRLSFSKNPLFIKPTKESGISFSFRQMGTALLADL